jgi:hypothetical protein
MLTETPSPIIPPTLLPSPSQSPIPTPTPIWGSNFLIAYIKDSIDPSYPDDNSLYIISSKGDNKINVFKGLSGLRGWSFSWSPSGSWLTFEELNRSYKEDNTKPQYTPGNLWVVRSNGTNRRKLFTFNDWYSIQWAIDKDIIITKCSTTSGDTELCIIDPINGVIGRTRNFGSDPKFSSDGNEYAYIQNGKALYVANSINHTNHRIFSTSGNISDYSWTTDQKSIIAAIVNREGCGNELDGSTSIILISIQSKSVIVLREIQWSISNFKLSPDQRYLLTNWWLCVGNSYGLDGVIGLRDELITWPLRNLVSHVWSNDGKYLIETDWATGARIFLDPSTGNYVAPFDPPFIGTLLTDQERKDYVNIYWVPQSIVD